MGEIYSLRLVVEKQDPGRNYRARWIEESGHESQPFELKLPLTEEDTAELRWYLEKFRGFLGPGTRVQVQQVEKRLEELGHELFRACFGGSEGTNVYRNLLDAVKAGRQARLTLASNESIFLQQPWELMRDHRGPLVFHDVSIRRQLVGAKPAPSRPMEFKLPLRLLLVVARPTGVGFIDPRSSMAPLLDALDSLPGAVELEFCQPPTLARLEELVSAARQEKKPVHIVHFDGHGTYLPQTGVGALAFENVDRTYDLVTARRLGDLLARLEIPLVILEACRTSDLSDAPVFGSLAPALLESGVGSVVAFSHTVHVEASRILVERFYRELAAGRSVGQALAEARAALRAKPQRWLHLGPKAKTYDKQDWFIPQLYQVGADPALLAKSGRRKKVVEKERPEERMYGFPPKPLYRFHGRAKDLLELERAFERHPAVLLAGGGGMGKTALAREAAFWWLRTGRFERAVFVSFERPTVVERVVQELGRAFEGVEFASRSGEEQQKAALRLFRERRVLLVWDNFESTLPQFQQGEAGGPVAYPDEERLRLRRFFEQLTESRGEGRLLVTCRPAESTLPGIKERSLGGLDRPDSLYLLHAVADIKDIDLERKGFSEEEIGKLLDLLGDHPLSLSLVGPHLKSLKPAEIRGNFASLLDRFKDDSADEERNRSLRASLVFSASRLSAAAKQVLPWLAWFHGGTFEVNLLRFFAELVPDAWTQIRPELEATALLRVEQHPMFQVPFLHFHPTLPYAAPLQEVVKVEAAEQRFVAVYLELGKEARAALNGDAAASGIKLVEREETNFRSALEIAFRHGERDFGVQLADTLTQYLRYAARLRERDVLVDWVKAWIPEVGRLDVATCAAIHSQAVSLVNRGQSGAAVAILKQLIGRLEAEGLADRDSAASELGASFAYLGQILVEVDRPDLAITPCLQAIGVFEKLSGYVTQGNLATVLGDLAMAYSALGRPGEALAAAERGLAIDRDLDRQLNVAAAIGRIARILTVQQRWGEAEARYMEALDLARRIGDLHLQADLLQHQGIVYYERGNLAKVVEYGEQAILLFQQAGNAVGEMRTFNLLAVAEVGRGRLDVAEAWYKRARELALLLKDDFHIGATAQNLGNLYQTRAEQDTDAAGRIIWLQRALASVEEGLAISLERNDQVSAAGSYRSLGVLYRLLNKIDLAKSNAELALKILEPLHHPYLELVYGDLAVIEADRRNSVAAAEWAAKRDAKSSELKLLRQGQREG